MTELKSTITTPQTENEKRIKELEYFLNFKLDAARVRKDFPSPVTLGYSTVFMCSNSEEVEKWRQANARRFATAD